MEMERDGNFKFKTPNYTTVDDTIAEHLAKVAEEMTSKIFPSLLQKLQSDLSYMKALPIDELGELLGQRLCSAAFQYFVHIKVWRMNPKGEINTLARRVYDVFVSQIKEYHKKYEEDIGQTVLKAKEGNTMAICRLLEWDKSWIDFDFIHGQISRRGYRYRNDKDDLVNDKSFLRLVAAAISKKPYIRDNADESGLLSAIEFYANRYDLSGKNNGRLKSLYNRLLKESSLDSVREEEGDPLSDFKYFKKYLKRHHII
jgi:hypothetical protein